MQDFLSKLDFYAKVSALIVKGKKIKASDYAPHLIQDLEKLTARMYTGFFSPLEPNSLIFQKHWGKKERRYMGMTSVHPMMAASANEAKNLLDQNSGIAIFGYKMEDRHRDISHNPVLQASVLTKGDFVALAQATAEIQRRIANPESAPFAPLIIQDRAFWGSLFTNEPTVHKDLEKYGIKFSSGADKTQAILKKHEKHTGQVQENNDVALMSPHQVDAPQIIFASTDHLKTSHLMAVQNEYEGDLSVAHTVVGPSRIPVEEKKTYAGNAFVKLVASMMVALERLPDTTDENAVLSVHDGGLAFLMMNKNGDRYTEIFTDAEFFPSSAEYMNKIQAGPGVELAELYKSCTDFRLVMDALHRKVDAVCKVDKRFKPSDLCAFDSAVQMSIPFKEFKKLYAEYRSAKPELTQRKICEHIARAHAVVVGDVQKVGVLKQPQYNSEPLSYDTEHFIEAEGHEGLSRTQVPEWIQSGPNAVSYRLMMDTMGAKHRQEAANDADSKKAGLSVKIAVPGMLVGAKAKDDSNTEVLKKLLHENGVNFRLGTEYWREFQDVTAAKRQRKNTADFQQASNTHRQNIRGILEMHDFLYVPKDALPASPEEKLEFLLLLCSAVVQRQVFKKNAPFIIMERGPLADLFIELFKSLKNKGLIGQRFEHLVHLTDSPEESARIIKSLASMYPPKTRAKTILKDSVQMDEPENFTAAIYCSATNKNAVWMPDVKAIARHMAISGMDLKLGGGSDGMMKAAADGYLEGLNELSQQGIVPTGKLHLIQCKDTVTIEGDYGLDKKFAHLDQFIERICCQTIEERRYILQKSHMPLGAPGGVGTVEEVLCEILAKIRGETSNKVHLFSQSVQMANGDLGHVYDVFEKIIQDVLKIEDLKLSRTLAEMLQTVDDKKSAFDQRKRKELESKVNVVEYLVPQVA